MNSYFDTRYENAGKKDFAADREMMLQLFVLIRLDETLREFHVLSWDGEGQVSQFTGVWKRGLEEYDKILPVGAKVSIGYESYVAGSSCCLCPGGTEASSEESLILGHN
ncbi:hypothetical protein Pmar_PMAR015134 [Perkinsus marinus ATCC 50983]|uniref:Uncharacterized protein n=1 Tax=Perkinsus marinus (strain ATCC 50983 / TXsc) TaxID=423536 RepID=C5LZH0_PERM5|nr:hypothetical protein Pmar_PMAR015134 [Perkinsus marinus ATCC 50983]EEQ97872.1 hypothetical protein Pmar_PMAR015134 [Perkinsus marinus ATCC 50983]|eukprot:XP_002765155.1 hypothetical protein Pmar_PMAR015134 [Perkinsus marinus ATCC 50983]